MYITYKYKCIIYNLYNFIFLFFLSSFFFFFSLFSFFFSSFLFSSSFSYFINASINISFHPSSSTKILKMLKNLVYLFVLKRCQIYNMLNNAKKYIKFRKINDLIIYRKITYTYTITNSNFY